MKKGTLTQLFFTTVDRHAGLAAAFRSKVGGAWVTITHRETLDRVQGRPGRVEILDVGERDRSPGHVARSQGDLEAVHVVPDVVRLVGVRRAEQCGVDRLRGLDVGHGDHQAADRRTHARLLYGAAVGGAAVGGAAVG
jgi:hypothetical protein